jgi:hypothetical protein
LGIKIENSIDVAQSKARKQTPHLIHSSQPPSKIKKTVDEGKKFLEELGLDTQQFRILVECLPQAVAVYKMAYYKKGKPTEYILLASNKSYDSLHFFQRARIGKKASQFSPALKKDRTDWIKICGKVATTGLPKTFEIRQPEDKWYQIYAYSQRHFYCNFIDVTEEKRAAQKLGTKKSEEQPRLSEKSTCLYETTQDGIGQKSREND